MVKLTIDAPFSPRFNINFFVPKTRGITLTCLVTCRAIYSNLQPEIMDFLREAIDARGEFSIVNPKSSSHIVAAFFD